MSLEFGTDGVRGVANAELTPELTLALGRAAARVIGGGRFLVGRDTRRSGPLLFSALAAGLAAEGLTIVDLGVLPTPGVAFESAAEGVGAAMISASHNPFQDNGIKFFLPGGRKLTDEVEARIEEQLRAIVHAAPGAGPAPPVGSAVGTIVDGSAGRTGYADALVESLEGRRLDGLTVVLDCAHGAAFEVAPAVLARLGATVHAIHDRPDGQNINHDCGSTHPQNLVRAVVARGADLGLAFDGDADRLIAVDAAGRIVDGDQIMAVCALDLSARGRLAHDTLVVTVMSNLGLKLAMAERGIKLRETKVGDRHVLEELEAGGYSLGGEQSGHVIFRDRATTGDGLLTGLVLGDIMWRSGRSLADLAGVMRRFPQVLRNVSGVDRARLQGAEELWAEVQNVEEEMGSNGRVLIRRSGTEPFVRVMVEASTQEDAERVCERLCVVVARELAFPAQS